MQGGLGSMMGRTGAPTGSSQEVRPDGGAKYPWWYLKAFHGVFDGILRANNTFYMSRRRTQCIKLHEYLLPNIFFIVEKSVSGRVKRGFTTSRSPKRVSWHENPSGISRLRLLLYQLALVHRLALSYLGSDIAIRHTFFPTSSYSPFHP